MRGHTVEQIIGGIGALTQRFAERGELLFGAAEIGAEIVGLLLQYRTDLRRFVLQSGRNKLHLRAGIFGVLE